MILIDYIEECRELSRAWHYRLAKRISPNVELIYKALNDYYVERLSSLKRQNSDSVSERRKLSSRCDKMDKENLQLRKQLEESKAKLQSERQARINTIRHLEDAEEEIRELRKTIEDSSKKQEASKYGVKVLNKGRR